MESRTVITNPFYSQDREFGEVGMPLDEPSEQLTSQPADRADSTPALSEVSTAGLQAGASQVAGDVWVLLTSGKNMVAGLAAATHVNIYLLSLGLILSTPYFSAMATLQVAVVGTIIMQVTAVFLSPYNEFAIANCDSVPAAVMVNAIGLVV